MFLREGQEGDTRGAMSYFRASPDMSYVLHTCLLLAHCSSSGLSNNVCSAHLSLTAMAKARKQIKNSAAGAQDDVERRAREAYEVFHMLPKGSCTLEQVKNSAAGVQGWATSRQCLSETAEIAPALESHAVHTAPTCMNAKGAFVDEGKGALSFLEAEDTCKWDFQLNTWKDPFLYI